jgi:TctA family transporter
LTVVAVVVYAPPLPDRRLRLALTVGALLVFAASSLVASSFALAAAPLFFLLLALLSGVWPGERLIERYRRRCGAPAGSLRGACRRSPAPRVVFRRGRLVVSGMAMRPPPALRASLG